MAASRVYRFLLAMQLAQLNIARRSTVTMEQSVKRHNAQHMARKGAGRATNPFPLRQAAPPPSAPFGPRQALPPPPSDLGPRQTPILPPSGLGPQPPAFGRMLKSMTPPPSTSTSTATYTSEGEGGGNATGGIITNTFPPDWPFLPHCLKPKAPGGFLDNTLPTCKEGQTSDFTRDTRIAVVGGGPAGVSVSKLLFDRGFKNIKLIEITDRIGGKSKRFEVDGKAHETGTCYVTGKYECIEAWAGTVHMTEVPIDKARLVNSPNLGFRAPRFVEVGMWAAAYTFKRFSIPPDQFLDTYTAQVQSYVKHWMASMGTLYMFPSHGLPNSVALNMTFEQWLMKRNLTALLSIMTFSMSGQGYGPPDKVSAYHGLTWNHPNLMIGTKKNHAMFKEGFQTLWERLIGSTSVEVSLGTTIKTIKRVPTEGGKTKVAITYEDGRKEDFDWLIMAAPMPEALKLFEHGDLGSEEKDLFSSYAFRQLVFTINKATSTGSLPKDFELFSWADRLGTQSDFYRKTFDWEQRAVARTIYDIDSDDGPLLIRFTSNIKGFSHLGMDILQISSPETTDAKLTELIQSEVGKYGIELEPLARERWNYAPMFTIEEVMQGRPWKIWNIQGRKSTWWVGSYVSFESIADVVDYNFQLIQSRLCDPSR